MALVLKLEVEDAIFVVKGSEIMKIILMEDNKLCFKAPKTWRILRDKALTPEERKHFDSLWKSTYEGK